jgi:hypothetical protein
MSVASTPTNLHGHPARYGYLELDEVDVSLSGLIGSSKQVQLVPAGPALQLAGSLSDAVCAFQSFYGLQVGPPAPPAAHWLGAGAIKSSTLLG